MSVTSCHEDPTRSSLQSQAYSKCSKMPAVELLLRAALGICSSTLPLFKNSDNFVDSFASSHSFSLLFLLLHSLQNKNFYFFKFLKNFLFFAGVLVRSRPDQIWETWSAFRE